MLQESHFFSCLYLSQMEFNVSLPFFSRLLKICSLSKLKLAGICSFPHLHLQEILDIIVILEVRILEPHMTLPQSLLTCKRSEKPIDSSHSRYSFPHVGDVCLFVFLWDSVISQRFTIKFHLGII